MDENRPKYIAKGFVEDAGDLMDDFLRLNSVEFSDFASVWREHHFSLIFMGRPDHTEASEFTNEIFRITMQYLLQKSFFEHVGGVYLLYALYRNQISDPPVKIRLEMKHWKVVKTLRNEAFEKEYKTLHYVIDFLIDHAFQYVVNQTLRGPLIAGLPTAHDVSINKLKGEYKDTFTEYTKCSSLLALRDLHRQYLEEIKKFEDCSSVSVSTSNQEIYDKALKEFQDFVEEEKQREKNANVGNRKSKLKAEAFQKKSKNRFEAISSKLDELAASSCYIKNMRIVSGNPQKGEKKPARPRKEDRRPGRPSKKPKEPTPVEPKSDDEIDISHLVAQQKDLYLPPVYGEVRKCRTKRDAYYQVSPKKKESYFDSSENSE